MDKKENENWHLLAEFQFPSQPGNERQAMDQVGTVVEGLGLPPDRLERLKTAVAEATMNAMEHGNRYQPDLPAEIEVLASDEKVLVRIIDYGGGKPIPEHVMPDLDKKLAGLQTPRGWGLFLIEKMVDQIQVSTVGERHMIELVMYLKEVNP